MQVVIDIPEETYEYWKEHSYEYVLSEAIKNGTPLPKGHGRLIDADALEIPSEEMISRMVVHHAPTIIEADGGDAE